MGNLNAIEKAYEAAKQRYSELGVDADKAMEQLRKTAISIHCWQGDDVGGFESEAGLSGGGIQATGNYPGQARTADQLRADLEKVFSLVPGKHRLNLHAMYAETAGKVDRNELQPEHFKSWIDWAKDQGIGMDFNQTFFSHPKADSGFTLSSYDKDIIGAVGLMSKESEIMPVILDWDEKEQGFKAVKTFVFGELLECDAIGTGVIMIKRKVFETIEPPYFKYTYDEDGLLELGQDFYFCQKAQRAGFKIYAHTGMLTSHYQTVDLLPIFKRFAGLTPSAGVARSNVKKIK